MTSWKGFPMATTQNSARASRTQADEPTPEAILDVRDVAPPKRHPLIFGTYESLGPNQRFVLVNDHDPKPLFYQFHAEHTGEFSWEYLEQGPKTWRIRIGKRKSSAERTPLPTAR